MNEPQEEEELQGGREIDDRVCKKKPHSILKFTAVTFLVALTQNGFMASQ